MIPLSNMILLLWHLIDQHARFLLFQFCLDGDPPLQVGLRLLVIDEDEDDVLRAGWTLCASHLSAAFLRLSQIGVDVGLGLGMGRRTRHDVGIGAAASFCSPTELGVLPGEARLRSTPTHAMCVCPTGVRRCRIGAAARRSTCWWCTSALGSEDPALGPMRTRYFRRSCGACTSPSRVFKGV